MAVCSPSGKAHMLMWNAIWFNTYASTNSFTLLEPPRSANASTNAALITLLSRRSPALDRRGDKPRGRYGIQPSPTHCRTLADKSTNEPETLAKYPPCLGNVGVGDQPRGGPWHSGSNLPTSVCVDGNINVQLDDRSQAILQHGHFIHHKKISFEISVRFTTLQLS
ncbi:hypothetical protein E2C01_007824 [Portunus trituberculatus]|uniref:Uncharacterized protein n=1 Tax=Portunus trituberculatus TaxID=210409 RepID=A0A5B7D1F9_PORTR|nr:hypothetical protein [Portunus trituberculatus]